MEAIILAAGLNERFGGNCPKCLYRIDGDTIIGRLARHCDLPITIVINAQWAEHHIQMVENLGRVVKVGLGCKIGESIARGLQEVKNDLALIYNADNYVLNTLPTLMQPGALFDPWEWVTIWCVVPTPSCITSFRVHCTDKVEYMIYTGIRPEIKRLGLINVNRREDLQRCC